MNKIISFFVVCLLGATVYADYDYSATFTFSGYSGSEELKDFPVLIRLSNDSPKGFSKYQLQADFKDLAFFAGEIPLEYEIEKKDPDGTSYVWVKVPSLTKETVITAKWGDKDAANAPIESGKSSLWTDSGYAGVWHFSEDSGTVADSSGNNLHAEPKGNTAEMVSFRRGAVGNARFLTTTEAGNKNNLFETNPYDLQLGSNFTFSAWVRCPYGLTGNWRLVSRKSYYADSNGWEIQGNNGAIVGIRSASDASSQISLDDASTKWCYYTFVYDGENSKARVYSNGSLKSEVDMIPATDNGQALRFGQKGYPSYLAAYDECRLSGKRLSGDWVQADYDTVSKSDFYVASEANVIGGEDEFTVVSENPIAGAVFPSAGVHKVTDGQTITFSAPSSGFTGADFRHAKYVGYTLIVDSESGSERVEFNELSGSYTHKSGSKAYLVWKTASWNTAQDFGTKFSSIVTVNGFEEPGRILAFPVLFKISEEFPAGFRYEDVKSDGSDILFTDMSGTVIPHEIENWNQDGISYVWVMLPSLYRGAQFVFRYGSQESVSKSDPQGVWSETGYSAVWHFNEPVSAGNESANDSTGNMNTATPTGTTSEMLSESGAAGAARTIASTSVINYFKVKNSSSIDMGDEFTVSFWMKASKITNNGRIFQRKNNYVDKVGWEVQWRGHSADAPIFSFRGANSVDSQTTVPQSLKKWTHLAFAVSDKTAKAFVNGAEVSSGSINTVLDNDLDLLIGGVQQVFNGAFDETRLLKGPLDAARLKADYLTVASPEFLKATPVQDISNQNTFTVQSSGEERGEVVPAWGIKSGIKEGEEVVFSAPGEEQAVNERLHYIYTGYKLYVTGADLVERLVDQSNATSGKYIHKAGELARLEWQIVDLHLMKTSHGENGKISASGYYPAGENLLVEGIPDEGYRVRSWYTNSVLAAEYCSSISVVVPEGGMEISCEFEKKAQTVVFWDASEEEPGGQVTEFEASYGASVFKCTGEAVGNTGSIPVYSSLSPASVILQDALGSGVLVKDPKSVAFENGTVRVAGLAEFITANDAVTVEAFVKLNRMSSATYLSAWSADLDGEASEVHKVFTPAVNISATRLSCEKGAHKGKYIAGPAMCSRMDEAWHHVAVVYDKVNSKATLYVDYEASSNSLELNIKPPTEGKELQFFIGSGMADSNLKNNFSGLISSFRVSKGALNINEFMRASYNVADDTLALFKLSGKTGEKAIKFGNSVGEKNLFAHVPQLDDESKYPVYADEAPGESIYPSSLSTNGLKSSEWRPLVRRPGSIRLPGVNGSQIILEDLASAVTASKGSFTIEFFAKNEYDTTVKWKTALCAPIKHPVDYNYYPKIALPGDSGGGRVTFQHFTAQISANVNYGSWKHIAIVYDASSKQVGGYVDYKLVMPFKSFSSVYTAAALYLGGKNDRTEPFCGLMSTLRVTDRALKPEEFMIAAPAPEKGLKLIVR